MQVKTALQLKAKGETAATKTSNRKAAAYAATWMVASVRCIRLRGETAASRPSATGRQDSGGSENPVETVGV